MAKVNVDTLDLPDVNDLLTELLGKPSKEKKVADARAKLKSALETKGMSLSTDEDGNFVLEAAKKAKAKAKAEEVEEEAEEEDEEEAEEEEAEEEDEEEEVEETKPAPKAKAKAKPAPAPAPKAKAKAKAKDEDDDEDEEEEVEETKPKRAPPPRDARYKPTQKIKVLMKDASFREGSGRARKWELVKSSKTVGEFLSAAGEEELATPMGFLGHCVKTGKISIT